MQILKNNEARPKFTGSYKKKSVYTQIINNCNQKNDTSFTCSIPFVQDFSSNVQSDIKNLQCIHVKLFWSVFIVGDEEK